MKMDASPLTLYVEIIVLGILEEAVAGREVQRALREIGQDPAGLPLLGQLIHRHEARPVLKGVNTASRILCAEREGAPAYFRGDKGHDTLLVCVYSVVHIADPHVQIVWLASR